MLPMWRVVRADGTVAGYLLGSVHLLPSADSALPDGVMEAFKDADTLVVEVDVKAEQDSGALTLRTMQLGMYPKEDGLAAHLPEELYKEVVEVAAPLGMPEAVVQRMRPWLLSMTLTVARLAKKGYSPELGVDVQLMNAARAAQPAPKAIVPLETAESQLMLFAGMEEKDQVAFLQDTVTRLETPDEIRKLYAAWRVGDVAALEALVFASLRQDPSLQPFYESFYFARNRAMADKLVGLFAQSQQTFVVVGTAHLVGEGSVVHLLQQRGLTVEQLAPPTVPPPVAPEKHAEAAASVP